MSDQDCTSWFEAAHAAKWLRMIVIATDHNLGRRGATVCEVMVHCTGRNGRRYSRPATGHRFQVALVANHLLAVQNVCCGRGVRDVGPSSGAIGAARRRRRRVRPSSNDGFSAREYRNDTLRKPTLNEYACAHAKCRSICNGVWIFITTPGTYHLGSTPSGGPLGNEAERDQVVRALSSQHRATIEGIEAHTRASGCKFWTSEIPKRAVRLDNRSSSRASDASGTRA